MPEILPFQLPLVQLKRRHLHQQQEPDSLPVPPALLQRLQHLWELRVDPAVRRLPHLLPPEVLPRGPRRRQADQEIHPLRPAHEPPQKDAAPKEWRSGQGVDRRLQPIAEDGAAQEALPAADPDPQAAAPTGAGRGQRRRGAERVQEAVPKQADLAAKSARLDQVQADRHHG